MAILEVHELTKWFGPLAAVRGVDISLGKAEILGMIGPNGAGKTTLFNVIAGVHKPTSGKVLLEGKVISGLPPHRICKRGVAKTSQMAGPFPGLSVLENVLVGALHGGQLKMKPALERAEEVLELVGLRTAEENPRPHCPCPNDEGSTWLAHLPPARRSCCSTRTWPASMHAR